MSDWIDDLKAQQREEQAKQAAREKLQLHKAEIVRAKAPTFWNELKRRLAVDCDKLVKEFPDDKQYQCVLTLDNENALTLAGNVLPQMILHLTFRPDAHSIEVTESQRVNQWSSAKHIATEEIEISADAADRLEFRYGGARYMTVEQVSERLLSTIIHR